MPAKNQTEPVKVNEKPPAVNEVQLGQLMQNYMELYLIVDTINITMEKLAQLNETRTVLERLGIARQLVLNELQALGGYGVQMPTPPEPTLPEEVSKEDVEEPLEEPADLSTPIKELED